MKPPSAGSTAEPVDGSKPPACRNPENHLPDDAVARIAAAYVQGEPLDGLVAVTDRAQAEENDYHLSPSRYLANGDAHTLRGEIPEIVKELAALKQDEAKLDQDPAKVLAQL